MERYIQQLIEDMQEAATKVPLPGAIWDSVNMDDPGELEDIAYVEKVFYGTPQPLSEIVGIEKMALPPLERLNTLQLCKLATAITELLQAYHFYPDFPEGLPAHIQYQLLHQEWDKPHVLVGAGENRIDFCKSFLSNCPFPVEYCRCLKFNEEVEREEEELRKRRDNEDEEHPL